MRNYGLALLGLSEVRWNQSGTKRLTTGEVILYSGHEDENAHHTEGVAIMMSKEAQKALTEWEPIDSRIITATFKTGVDRLKIKVIQCYAPTNDAEETVKDNFYDRLQSVIMSSRSKKEITVLMGDLNAKIGADNRGYERTMGRHGLGQMNENEEKFADFCAEHDLVIGGSCFPHKDVHKSTWVSPDQNTTNQIDHICIKRDFRSSLQDVRTKRGADAASDHHLVVATMKLKLKKHSQHQQGSRTKFNVNLLKEKKMVESFKIQLTNKYEVLQELLENEDTGIEDSWKGIKETFIETCKETIGTFKTGSKPWISERSLKKIQERKEMKEKVNNSRTRAQSIEAQRNYTTANKEVKSSIKEDKKQWTEDLAVRAEEAASQNNMKELYDTTRKLAGRSNRRNAQIKDKQGNSVASVDKQLERWAEYFGELLNRNEPNDRPTIPPATDILPISTEKPTKAEITAAIKKLNSGKAPGPDGIPVEAMKADIESSTNMLYSLFGKIWESEEIPEDWKEGFIVTIPKKGDISECKNYRGIMLLSAPGNVLNRVILDRLKDAVDTKLRDNQAGFRKQRACVDQIQTLRMIIEQSLEWNASLYINFIDFEKAFDSVDRKISVGSDAILWNTRKVHINNW